VIEAITAVVQFQVWETAVGSFYSI